MKIPTTKELSQSDGYRKIKSICINGISPNLCDFISKDYGHRCRCVVRHFEGKADNAENITPNHRKTSGE